MLLLRGNSPSEKEEESDHFSVVGTRNADVATMPCSEKQCSME
jgi:hypothetical protein